RGGGGRRAGGSGRGAGRSGSRASRSRSSKSIAATVRPYSWYRWPARRAVPPGRYLIYHNGSVPGGRDGRGGRRAAGARARKAGGGERQLGGGGAGVPRGGDGVGPAVGHSAR